MSEYLAGGAGGGGLGICYNHKHIKFSISKGKTDKYNETATKRTDGKQSWQPFSKTVTKTLLNISLTYISVKRKKHL